MVIVKLRGGLANQMFQYACGRALTLKNGGALKLDLQSFPDHNQRQYELNCFNIQAEIASLNEIRKLRYQARTPQKMLKDVFHFKFKKTPSKYVFKERDISVFDPSILGLNGEVYLDGSWQTEKYFSEFKSEIIEDFKPKESLSSEVIEVENLIKSHPCSVSMHFRRGDYVSRAQTNAYHGTCSIDYYFKSIEAIRGKNSGIKLFIFSDDPDWVQENFDPAESMEIVSGNFRGFEDMYLMSCCHHNVIANSSFSWWGAWLNPNPDKIVVAPKKWFNKGQTNESIVDLIPSQWIRI